MTELYPNVSEQMRQYAQVIFEMALQMQPQTAAQFLHNIVNEFKGTDEEVEFLQFYFGLRMEMMNNERNDSTLG